MAVSKFTLFALATLTVISTLVAKFQSIVDINVVEYESFPDDDQKDNLVPDAQLRHVMWFLQISDLHLSIFQDKHRALDLKKFCSETVSVIKPSVVLATGDLVDARTTDILGSQQFVEEWKTYHQILKETNVTNKTVWLDIRGNHDAFNVLSLDANNNFYRNYSVQGKKEKRSYSYTLNHDSENYTFIGIDACMDPGPKRPFNFLGVLSEEEYNHILKLKQDAEGNIKIWFGHYPTSIIVAPKPGARELMRSSGPYLCGHLHTLAGLVPAMYTLQNTGVLELELADWKENRKYRLGVVDHGMFSFVDNYVDDWPLILVVNPKAALFSMPTIEPLHRMQNSTYIRVLIFSPYPIASAELKIDDGPWQLLKVVENPLYVLKWNPALYSKGLHKITVFVMDKNGRKKTVNHQFSLDSSRPKFPLLARLTLMGHIKVLQIIFLSLVVLLVLGFTTLKICLHFGKGRIMKIKSEYNCFRRMLFKLALLANTNVLFWPVYIGLIYTCAGPWFIGYLVDDCVGICFVWGIYIGDKYLPGGLTYFAGIAYLVLFYIPVLLCLSQCLYCRYQQATRGIDCKLSLFSSLCPHFLMSFFVIWQILCAVAYYLSYGTMALILGFSHTWSVFFALVLWGIASTLPESKITTIGKTKVNEVNETQLLQKENNSKVNRASGDLED